MLSLGSQDVVAAAISLQANVSPAEIDIKKLQTEIKKQGVRID
jgi:hypothetical protein